MARRSTTRKIKSIQALHLHCEDFDAIQFAKDYLEHHKYDFVISVPVPNDETILFTVWGMTEKNFLQMMSLMETFLS